MSILQEQAVQMINGLSDVMSAFQRLNAARGEIRKYLPEDFDPDRELAEARAELNFRDSGNFAGESAESYTLRKPPVEKN